MKSEITKNQIGRYVLPADFKYLTTDFILQLLSVDYISRLKLCYEYFSNTTLSNAALKDLEELDADIVSLDGYLGVLELNNGNTLCYTDYIFDKSSPLGEIYSLASVFLSAYCELVNSGIIKNGDNINYSCSGDDGRLALALYLLKRSGVPINTIILGTSEPQKEFVKEFYVETASESDVSDITFGLFEETEYLLDPISARGMVAEDYYYADYDDGCYTLLVGLVSPYFYARKLLKVLTGKNELSQQKAVTSLYLEPGEVPESILSGSVQPFYKENAPINLSDAIAVINA